MIELHSLAPNKGAHTRSFRLGRGAGSGRGKTAGKGTKGQKARSGGKKGLALKGMRHMLLSFPKIRGFRSLEAKAIALPVERLNVFADGAKVDLNALRGMRVIGLQDTKVKVIGNGELKKKLIVSGLVVTASAQKAIEQAGGSVAASGKKKTAKKA